MPGGGRLDLKTLKARCPFDNLRAPSQARWSQRAPPRTSNLATHRPWRDALAGRRHHRAGGGGQDGGRQRQSLGGADAGRRTDRRRGQGCVPAVPLFFSATVEQTVKLGVAEVVGEARSSCMWCKAGQKCSRSACRATVKLVEVSGRRFARLVGAAGLRRGERQAVSRFAAPAFRRDRAPSDLALVMRTRLRNLPCRARWPC